MAVIEVPDFKTAQDFSQWVEGLDEKYIQSWKTKDWLAMYEKLTALVDNDKSVEEDYKRHIKEMERMESPEKLLMKKLHKWLNTPLNQIGKSEEIGSVVLRQHFTGQKENIAAFIKLHNNYRFEPQQLKAIREFAKINGKKASEDQYIDLSRISAVMNESVPHRDNMLETAKKIDEVVKNHTDLPDEKSSRIIVSRFKKRGSGDASNYDGKPRIRLGRARDDVMLEVMFHEAAHAHLQNSSGYQQEMLSKGQLPLMQYSQELNKDFYELMWHNLNFYLHPDKGDEYVYSLMLEKGSMTDEEVIKKKTEIFNGYRRQPTERFSRVFGFEAEREFRHQTNQNSERSAFCMKRFLQPLMGEPVDSKYVNGNIQIEYNSTFMTVNSKELIRRFDYLMEGADTKLLEAMNIHEEGKNVVLTIPKEYSFWEKMVEVVRRNYLKNNILTYNRNKLAEKIDKAASAIGIDSHLQDYKMPKSYKNEELKMSRKLEKINRAKDFANKQKVYDLKKAAKMIKDGLKTAQQFIKNKISKER